MLTFTIKRFFSNDCKHSDFFKTFTCNLLILMCWRSRWFLLSFTSFCSTVKVDIVETYLNVTSGFVLTSRARLKASALYLRRGANCVRKSPSGAAVVAEHLPAVKSRLSVFPRIRLRDLCLPLVLFRSLHWTPDFSSFLHYIKSLFQS